MKQIHLNNLRQKLILISQTDSANAQLKQQVFRNGIITFIQYRRIEYHSFILPSIRSRTIQKKAWKMVIFWILNSVSTPCQLLHDFLCLLFYHNNEEYIHNMKSEYVIDSRC